MLHIKKDMKTPLIVSFFTKDTIYEKEIQELIESCRILHLDYVIEEKEDLGNWQRNCCQKPLFIYECLQKYKKPILWVDADGIILRTPNLSWNVDVGFYFNNWGEKQARAGTIFATPSPEALYFFNLWHLKCQENQNFPHGDQHFLPEVFKIILPSLNIGQLPLSYVHVFDRDPIPFTETHILHTQASRTAMLQKFLWNTLSSKDLKNLRIKNAPLRASSLPDNQKTIDRQN